MTCFGNSKFSRSLFHKKDFGLTWKIVFKSEYLFSQRRWDSSLQFEGIWWKIASGNQCRQLCKQFIIKFLLAYTFKAHLRDIFFSWTSDHFLRPEFGLNTAIINSVGIFRRWCKLNFGLLRGHVRSQHITTILLKE